MSDQNTYFQKDIMNKPLEKHGLLEEFNLPPKAIRFIRQNQRNIWLGLVCLVAAILAWSYYDYYTQTRNDKAAAMLSKAVQQVAPDKRAEMLDTVIAEYGSTGSALWAKIELGHLANAAADYDGAIKHYKEALDDISTGNPLSPLVQYSLAQAFENKKDYNDAIALYQKLVEIKGFTGEAYLALARIYEEQGAVAQAKEMYEKVLTLENESASVQEMVKSKLARM